MWWCISGLTGCRFASARFFICGIEANIFLAMAILKIFPPGSRLEKFFNFLCEGSDWRKNAWMDSKCQKAKSPPVRMG